jgi:hypothetical protein
MLLGGKELDEVSIAVHGGAAAVNLNHRLARWISFVRFKIKLRQT